MSTDIRHFFDAIAEEYDTAFTGSTIGRHQRNRVWKQLLHDLPAGKKLDILEINCGTGEDALWLAGRGHRVCATDISAEMIRIARSKAVHNTTFEHCAFDGLARRFGGQQFDLIFSDFAGLNCIDAEKLTTLQQDLAELLRPGGKMIAVVLGKKCMMERLFFTLKGEHQKARRRMAPASARLTDGVFQPTWYYTTAEIGGVFDRFALRRKRPIGLFIPPSYLEPLVKKYPTLLAILTALESLTGGVSFLSDYGDHTYLCMQKQPNRAE